MKKRIFLSIAILAVVSNAIATYHEPYSGSRIFWDTSTRTTIFNGGGYARVLQLQDRRLMAVCESGGIIKIAFSNNMGSSWSSATAITYLRNNTPDCVPDLIQLSSGTIIVAYNPRPNAPYTEDRKFGIRCKRSTDNGKTWSDEIFVNDALHTWGEGCWEPSLLELPSGELQLYFADEGPYTSSDEQQISMCRSFDEGLTWSSPQKISFRSRHRDGMPVPILKNDTIVVIIEDNGWAGINDFFPTTVRCPLDVNWYNYWVDGSSENRDKTLDFDFCPRAATGGAPYLRTLPWGETIMSYQSTYNHGSSLTMMAAVGDENARHFKALSSPFITSNSDAVLWNSLAVIDTGVVVAVGGVNSNIEMIKGYPVRKLQAPYGKPVINGAQGVSEGYFRPTATQIILGTQTGVRVTADFAYDEDSLYFTAKAFDRTQIANGSQCDGIRLLVDADNVSDTQPQTGVYSFFFRLDGSYQTWHGQEGNWKRDDVGGIHYVVSQSSNNYVVEAAIPWQVFGKMAPPLGQRMAATVEMQDRRSSTMVTERVPDAKLNESWTWMELCLTEKTETGIKAVTAASKELTLRTDHKQIHVLADEEVVQAYVFTTTGTLVQKLLRPGRSFSTQPCQRGVVVVRCLFADGKWASGKIIVD